MTGPTETHQSRSDTCQTRAGRDFPGKASGAPMAGLGRSPTFILLVALLITLPAPAIASHNSLGAHATVPLHSEVDLDEDPGTLTPDVTEPQAPTFHPELETPRDAPLDQSGARYTPQDGCTPASEYPTQQDHQEALREGEACYVGYLDGTLLYMQFTQIFSIHRSEDLLYPLNPSPDDDRCQGEDPDETLGIEPADEAIARADRGLNDPSCQPATHDQHIPGYLGVDTSLLEAPLQADDTAPGLQSVTGPPGASGTLTLPLFVTPYVYLFGDPHPDNEDPSQHEAGSGPFGPTPTEGGTPLQDLTGACGDRTHACTLLTPTDLQRYDPHAETLQNAGVSAVGEVPRLCMHTTAFLYEHPQPDTRLCGTDGRPMDSFLATTQAGGLGVDEAPPTWLGTLPGWYRASVIHHGGALAHQATIADAYVDDPVPPSVTRSLQEQDYRLPLTSDTGPDRDTMLPTLFAVNPGIPLQQDELDCLTPNILTDGQGTDTVPTEHDPGVYGTYQADALDLDVYLSPTRETEQTLLEATHPSVRPVIATAENLLGDQAGTSTPLPPTVDNAWDRVDPIARAEDRQTGEPAFEQERPAGLSCSPEGDLLLEEDPEELEGFLRFQARLQANSGNDMILPSTPQPPGHHTKDPTRFDEDGLPAPASDSPPTAWRPDAYSLEGSIHAVLDTNQNQKLDPCAQEAQSGPADACPWRALWDAYNPACQGPSGDECGTLLEEDGYDTDAGVGLYAVVTTTGPLLVADADPQSSDTVQDRTTTLGLSNPTGQNCLVATSAGFAPQLAQIHDVEPDELANELCPDTSDETALVTDGFRDQTADPARAGATVERGDASLAVAWTPLVPTPDATGLADTDQACLVGVFNVQADRTAADTQESLQLEGENRFEDCIPL